VGPTAACPGLSLLARGDCRRPPNQLPGRPLDRGHPGPCQRRGVAASAVAVVAIPGYLATGVSPAVALQD
jgi:hypothetical protein